MEGTVVPRILPTDVWAFHIPKNSPLFFFPNQFPITATVPGHPVDWCGIHDNKDKVETISTHACGDIVVYYNPEDQSVQTPSKSDNNTVDQVLIA